MELWHYLEILRRKKQGWFLQKDNQEERLFALSNILEWGHPGAIPYLMPFLKDDSKAISHTTCKVITQLFERIATKKGYYDTLKHCDISPSDLDFYGHNFSTEDGVTLYSIATLNGNGYLREKAILKLADTNSEKAIPFIVYRLADWVEAVRQAALKSIQHFKKTMFIKALVDHLTIFDWLQKVERTNLLAVHSDLMDFVVVANRNYVVQHFKTFTDRARILIAKQMVSSDDITPGDLKILLDDKHFLVRSFALAHFDKLTQAEIDHLLKDKSARVRIQTLYHLKSQENFPEIVFPFLSDNAASIRNFARYSLKNNMADFATIYNNHLLSNTNITGSLSGLAEVNGKDFVATILPFLNHDKIKIRKAAFLALKQLDNIKAYQFALQHLGTEHMGIRNIIIDYVAHTATTEVLQKAREIYAMGPRELKQSMLKLLSKVGKWTTIADIMIGTIDADENIRQLSFDYLQQWRKKANTYFTQPKQGELERANQVFRFAFEVHEEQKYFSQNPLAGIDFYLQ